MVETLIEDEVTIRYTETFVATYQPRVE